MKSCSSPTLGKWIALVLTSASLPCVYASEVVEYNPNIPSPPPTVSASSEVGMFGYVNEKFNTMNRQLQDSANRMDLLERDVARIKTLEGRIAELEAKVKQLSAAQVASSKTETTDSAASAGAKSDSSAPLSAQDQEAAQAAYKKAFDQLMAGKYPEAGVAFKSFVDKYPKVEQSSNAYYWLGETQFIARKFDLAQKSYAHSAEMNGPKAADALYKEIQCWIELKKDKDARATYDALKKNFPDAQATKNADKLFAPKSDAKK